MLALIFAAGLAATPPSNTPACDKNDGSTLAVEACVSEQLKSAEVDLARYVKAAKARAELISKGDESYTPRPSEKKTLEAFSQGEIAWKAYRDVECDALYDDWSGGSIASSLGTECETMLTRQHTHNIWYLWLTSPEGGAPDLPEPKVQLGY